MKKIKYTLLFLMVIGSFLFSLNTACALDFDFQPRLEAGMMSYTYEQSANSDSVLPDIEGTAGASITLGEIEVNTAMGFIGGGATLFLNRLFVDLSGQYAPGGSDHVTRHTSVFKESDENLFNLSTLTSSVSDYDIELDRMDYAISIGYAVTHRFSVFVGYKWAEVNLESTFDGPFSQLTVNRMVLHGRVMGSDDIEFKYEGPFIGVVHGWTVDGPSILKGTVSFNAGLAHLNSDNRRKMKLGIRVESQNGQDVVPIDEPGTTDYLKSTGETTSFSLGLNWRGTTRWKNLSYSLGLSGQRYQFESNASDGPDWGETVLRLKIGLAYLF